MTRYYIPGDPNSSPYNPAMGDIVIYRTGRQGMHPVESFPAIVVRAYDDDRCDLTVFSTTGVRHLLRIKYSGDVDAENCWCWLPAKEPRARTVEDLTGSGQVSRIDA